MRVEIEGDLRVNGEVILEHGQLVSLAIDHASVKAVVTESVPADKLLILRGVLTGFAPNVTIEIERTFTPLPRGLRTS